MPENLIFYIVFLSQIFFISYYYPAKIIKRIQHILTTYPPMQYPKLYPDNESHYRKSRIFYKISNQIIIALGLITMFVTILWDNSNTGKISEVVPTLYFFLQVIPLLIGEFSEFKYFKLMRNVARSDKRKADLAPRRLFDFISPVLFWLAVLLYFACILFYYGFDGISFTFSNDTFVILLSLTLSNLFFAAIIFWNLYGKKTDPHQTSQDRIQRIQAAVKSLVLVSIGISLFMIAFKLLNELHLDYLEPVAMSIYFQIIIFLGLGSMLRNLRIENLNFEVYRKDAI